MHWNVDIILSYRNTSQFFSNLHSLRLRYFCGASTWDFLGLQIARLENASQTIASTLFVAGSNHQNSLICGTEDIIVKFYFTQCDVREYWSEQFPPVHYFRSIYQRCPIVKCQTTQLFVTTTEAEIKNLCSVAKIDPLPSCLPHNYQPQQLHSLITILSWNWVSRSLIFNARRSVLPGGSCDFWERSQQQFNVFRMGKCLPTFTSVLLL